MQGGVSCSRKRKRETARMLAAAGASGMSCGSSSFSSRMSYSRCRGGLPGADGGGGGSSRWTSSSSLLFY